MTSSDQWVESGRMHVTSSWRFSSISFPCSRDGGSWFYGVSTSLAPRITTLSRVPADPHQTFSRSSDYKEAFILYCFVSLRFGGGGAVLFVTMA